MKKVIVDGSKSSDYGESVSDTMKILVPMCKKAKVELWKEKFEVGNGKVDLNSKYRGKSASFSVLRLNLMPLIFRSMVL